MNLNYDLFGRNELSRVYLAKPDKTILCALNSIDIESVDFNGKANDISAFSFDINKYVESNYSDKLIESNGYELLGKYMKILVTGIGWFVMDTPEFHNTGKKEYKTISASSAQIEYGQVALDTWKVNKGTTDSLEMLVDGNVEEIDGVEFAKENIKFCNTSNLKLSLVHILVSKVNGWKVGYVDAIPKTYESLDENGNTVTKDVLLQDEIGMFEIDYNDAYSFMVGDFEKYFNCIVDFDYQTFTVNFYRVENYGKDTSVTIGFRNVENSNDVTVDEDNIYTKFYVSGGDDLGIEQFNGGSNYLIKLSDYWLNEKYLSRSTINKYKAWEQFCYSARYTYGNLSKQWTALQDEITELYDRMPESDCDPENWRKLSDTELLTLKSDYEAEKLGYEKIYVDSEGNFDITLLDDSDDANRYHQIVDTILPNIAIEIANRELPTSEGETDYLKEYETKFEYYGLNELQVKLLAYQDTVNLMKKSHYDLTLEEYNALSQTDPDNYPVYTEQGFADKHQIYLDAYNQTVADIVDSCAYHIAIRESEIKAKETEQSTVNTTRSNLAKQMDMKTWSGYKEVYLLVDENSNYLTDEENNYLTTGYELSGFNEKELSEIDHLINPTTYTNENIFVASTESITDTVTVQQKLCETAIQDTEVYSIPQSIYSTSIDNILSLVGNELHAHDLDYGNYIRLGLRDDYYVKLRVMEMNYNPMLYDNNFSIVFSNMIKCSSKRNDFVSLLDMAGNLSKSSASNSYNGNTQITDDNIHDILQKILQSSSFKNNVQNIVNNNASNNTGNYITTGDIYGNNAFIDYINSKLIVADEVIANSGSFKTLDALVATIKSAIIGTSSTETGIIINLTAENATISEALIKSLIAQYITVGDLKAGNIITDKISILSQDGTLKIVGDTFVISDADGNPVVQLGKDKNGNYGLVISDSNGAILLDSQGLHEGIVPDDFIKTDMVADGSITESKIDKTNIHEWTDNDGNKVFDVSNMYYGNDKFSVSYSSMKNTVEQLQTKIGSIELMGEQIFKNEKGVLSPTSITVNAVCRNGVTVGKWYIDNVEHTSLVSADKLSITIPATYMSDKKSITIKVEDSTGNLYDTHTLYMLSDSSGQSAISVIITSEHGQVFDEDTTITNSLCTCTVYEGVNLIEPKSYKWLLATDDGNWTSVGTEKTLTMAIDKSIIRKRLVCEVDVDI